MISASKTSLSSTVTREEDKLSVAEMLQTDAAVPVNHISTSREGGRGCCNPAGRWNICCDDQDSGVGRSVNRCSSKWISAEKEMEIASVTGLSAHCNSYGLCNLI